jgi:hypothetical protein
MLLRCRSIIRVKISCKGNEFLNGKSYVLKAKIQKRQFLKVSLPFRCSRTVLTSRDRNFLEALFCKWIMERLAEKRFQSSTRRRPEKTSSSVTPFVPKKLGVLEHLFGRQPLCQCGGRRRRLTQCGGGKGLIKFQQPSQRSGLWFSFGEMSSIRVCAARRRRRPGAPRPALAACVR